MTPTPDYFHLLNIDRTYHIDKAELRRRFYAQSAIHHPDRAATQDATARENALQETARINEALRVLSHPMLRLSHLLSLEGHELPESYALPPHFMMEMMELNELAEDAPEEAQIQLANLEKDWQQHLDALVARYEGGERSEVLFAAFHEAYFRKKYLDRARG